MLKLPPTTLLCAALVCALMLVFVFGDLAKRPPIQGLPVALLPQCQPLPAPIGDGDLNVVLTLSGLGVLAVNGMPMPLDGLPRLLQEVFKTRISRLMFVSFEGSDYQELIKVIDRLQSVHADIVLLTPRSRRELDQAFTPGSNCWLPFADLFAPSSRLAHKL